MIDEGTSVQSNPPSVTNQHSILPCAFCTWTQPISFIGISGTTDEVIRRTRTTDEVIQNSEWKGEWQQ